MLTSQQIFELVKLAAALVVAIAAVGFFWWHKDLFFPATMTRERVHIRWIFLFLGLLIFYVTALYWISTWSLR